MPFKIFNMIIFQVNSSFISYPDIASFHQILEDLSGQRWFSNLISRLKTPAKIEWIKVSNMNV